MEKHPHQRPRGRIHLFPRPHEVRRLAPVGVGDGLAGHAGDDVQQQGELGGCVRWGEGLEVGEVLGVEGEDVGEAREVCRGDLAGAVRGDVEAVAGGFGDRAGVGRSADVPVAGAGGVRRMGEAGLVRAVAEGGFGQGGAADVAEADEEDGGGGRWGCHRAGVGGGGGFGKVG